MAGVGYVDQGAIADARPFSEASAQLSAYKEQLDKQLAKAVSAAHGAAEQQHLIQAFSQKFDDRRRALLAPLFARTQTAIASVASSDNLSIVVDKRIIITGGQDVTEKVIDLLTGIAAPAPPVGAPPPSDVGFVDQARIDEIPFVKQTMDVFANYRAAEQQRMESAMRAVKTTPGRQTLLKEYQRRLTDKRKATIDPLLERARAAIADAAGKKRLPLVIDRSDVLYGGTDITADVVKDLGG
jgi:outer membrane protein